MLAYQKLAKLTGGQATVDWFYHPFLPNVSLSNSLSLKLQTFFITLLFVRQFKKFNYISLTHFNGILGGAKHLRKVKSP